MDKLNCWELIRCGRERDCPAYPHHGRICYAVTGTQCHGQVQGSYAEKIGMCTRTCEVYEHVAGVVRDEGVQSELVKAVTYQQQLLSTAATAIFSIDPDGIVTGVNEEFLDITGYGRREVIGRPFTVFCAQRDLAQTNRTGRIRRQLCRIRTRNGHELTVLRNADPIVDEQCRVVGTIESFVDITELTRATEQAAAEAGKLRAMIENMEEGVLVADADGVITQANQWFLTEVDKSLDEVVGRKLWDFHPINESAEQVREVVSDFKSGGRRQAWTASGELQDMHVSLRLQPILRDEAFTGVILNVIDVSDQVKARVAAEEASRSKSQFLANMSHEIRTPINGIMGMTELALNTELTAEQNEYLEAVRVSADSLLALINDILDYSKIEAGKLELVDLEFALREAIADSMTMLATQAHAKNLELLYHVPPEIPDAVVGDPGRIRQILVNLVGNAIKFTEYGEVVVRVESTWESTHEIDLHFSVSDTGIGIPPDRREMIFRSFEQADGSTSRKYGGTGLGLAISSRFCEMMGGKIWVESEEGRGSTFHFTVRLRLAGHRTASMPREVVDPRDLPVLVVDDNATNRKILEQILGYWGMKPTVAASGRAAMAALEKAYDEGSTFRLIITDCMMPEMDGFELVRRIKEDPRLSESSTIVMLTSAGERGDAARCLELSIAAYLLKPVKQSELLFTVLRVLQGPSESPVGKALITRHSIRESRHRLHILLAEDNVINQKLATGMLERMGHAVTLARNGKEALETLERATFDLILMDVQMPEMDGLQATRILRDREKTTAGHIPVIAMTALAMSGDHERCLEAGMDGYLSKPINSQELFEMIEHIVQGIAGSDLTPLDSPQRTRVLDKSQVLEMVGGDVQLLKEIVALLLDDYPRLLGEIRESLLGGDPEGLEKAAHTLKGVVGNFGAESAVQAALKLESMGRLRNLDEGPQALMRLEREMNRLRDDLTALEKEFES